METIRTREATNPYDFSFGLQSAMEHFSKPNIPLPEVDYNVPLSSVYTQLTRYMIANFGSLMPLALAAHSSGPSWVPDYTQKFGYCYLLGISHELILNQPSSNQRTFADDATALLLVRGRKVNTVNKILCFMRTQTTYQRSEGELHRLNLDLMISWRAMRKKCFTQIPDNKFHHVPRERGYRAFMKIVFTKETAMSGAPYIPPANLEAYMSFLTTYRPGKLDDLFGTLTGDTHIRLSLWPITEHYVRQRFIRRRVILQTHITVTNFLASSGLSFLSTDEDIGLAAAIGDVRSGDELFAVEGLVPQLVMRKTRTNYRIVARANMPRTEDGWERWIRIE